jgi:hypothetical protein
MKQEGPLLAPTYYQFCVCAPSVGRSFTNTNRLYSCSVLYRKQSPLMYSQYLEDCALSLCEDKRAPSDPTLIHYVRLLRISSDVYTTFDHGGQDNVHEMNDDKVRSLVKVLERQLAEWRSSLPITVSEDG